MANRNDILYKKTFKDQVDELEKRVYYTLTNEDKLQAHKAAKALSILVKLLHDKNILSDDEVDNA
ncbi:MAG: hypothetical protein HN390_08330 [Anaerolineae bacterium]|jgi:hypothetical protein|nr:hypothetical protein [Anaerolineae bacterium]MBT7190636.1 hypothetical protein [Anaerolineae bacterium]MBT7992148.1 hypothetical protein [Anaerolineae bacterium]